MKVSEINAITDRAVIRARLEEMVPEVARLSSMKELDAGQQKRWDELTGQLAALLNRDHMLDFLYRAGVFNDT